jgi:hypothetical protein
MEKHSIKSATTEASPALLTFMYPKKTLDFKHIQKFLSNIALGIGVFVRCRRKWWVSTATSLLTRSFKVFNLTCHSAW